MTAPHWRLILNGKADDDEALRAAVAHWRGQGVQVSVRVTWETGDAARWVAEAIGDNVDTLIAAGGDGTLSEVATALASSEQAADDLPTLALLPLGTANDFATAAGIASDPIDALGLIASAPASAIDLLRVQADDGEHWCANLASGGFGTEVTVETDEGLKKMLGGLAYVITGIAKLGKIEPIPAQFSGPDFQWRGDFIALGIGNGRQAGGGQALCPDALIDDGLLDLTIVPELAGELAGTVSTLLTQGKHAALERIATRARLPSLSLRGEAPLTLNLDGEPVQSRQFQIDCVRGRVRMHLPEDSPLRSDRAA